MVPEMPVSRRILPASARSILPLTAIAAAAALLVSTSISGAIAQTPFSSLAAPNGPPASPHPSAAAKPGLETHGKPCGDYGAGFVSVPGTDTCVKMGAAVRTDAVVNSHR